MYRLIGAAFIIMGALGLGTFRLKCSSEKIKHSKDIHFLIINLINEIQYTKLPIPDACIRIQERVSKELADILNIINETYTNHHGQSFQSI